MLVLALCWGRRKNRVFVRLSWFFFFNPCAREVAAKTVGFSFSRIEGFDFSVLQWKGRPFLFFVLFSSFSFFPYCAVLLCLSSGWASGPRLCLFHNSVQVNYADLDVGFTAEQGEMSLLSRYCNKVYSWGKPGLISFFFFNLFKSSSLFLF